MAPPPPGPGHRLPSAVRQHAAQRHADGAGAPHVRRQVPRLLVPRAAAAVPQDLQPAGGEAVCSGWGGGGLVALRPHCGPLNLQAGGCVTFLCGTSTEHGGKKLADLRVRNETQPPGPPPSKTNLCKGVVQELHGTQPVSRPGFYLRPRGGLTLPSWHTPPGGSPKVEPSKSISQKIFGCFVPKPTPTRPLAWNPLGGGWVPSPWVFQTKQKPAPHTPVLHPSLNRGCGWDPLAQGCTSPSEAGPWQAKSRRTRQHEAHRNAITPAAPQHQS